jgi:purine-nucleoside phosphorylase
MTPHINARSDQFASTVIMPGDPLRARYIAEKFLKGAELITDVRNVLGFTGTYKGEKLSVMAHGMGIPSASIYTTELITEYGVKNIIRVGSCGAVSESVNLRDIVVAIGASTDSNVNRQRFSGFDLCAHADFSLAKKVDKAADELGMDIKVGNIFTSDFFYMPDKSVIDTLKKYRVLGIDMEAAGIYGVAAEYGAKAIAICTVSDHLTFETSLSSEERQTSFDEMIELALASLSK